MSRKTAEKLNAELVELDQDIAILNNAELPPISTVRFSRTTDVITDQIQKVWSSIEEKREEHQKTDEDGDPVYEVFVQETKIGESGARLVEAGGQKIVEEYKDIDFEDLDYEKLGIDPGEFEGEPPAQGQPIFENEAKWIEARRKILGDSVELDIYPFPAKESEEVLRIFAQGKTRQKADRIIEELSLEEDDQEVVKQILGVGGNEEGSPRGEHKLSPEEVSGIEFLFPEDL